MTNTEKNVAIALFLGIDVHKFSLQKDPKYIRVILGKEEDFDWDSITDFDPDTDWNWLHKAFVKFRELPIPEEHQAAFTYLYKQSIVNGFEYDNISEAFEALYEAVNWYQNLKSPVR